MSLQRPIGRQRHGWEMEAPERTDPFRRMSQQMERMFEDLVGTVPSRLFGGDGGGLAAGISAGQPSVDVSETKDALEIDVDLPGLDQRDIDITLNEDILTVTGERKEEREDRGRNFYRAERNYGRFSRRIMLPYKVDEERVVANFDKGVLHITLPKSAEARSRERHIEVRAR